MEGFRRQINDIPESAIETECEDEFVEPTSSYQPNTQTYQVWEGSQNPDNRPESNERENQYDDDDEFVEQPCFVQNAPAFPGNPRPGENVTRLVKSTKDCSTNTEGRVVEQEVVNVLDFNGLQHFGQFVTHELLQFNTDRRYLIMQKIIETLKTA